MSRDHAAEPAGRGQEQERRVRRLARVHGVVQGVGFRWATSARAEQLRVDGTVRNLWDGTVEADVEGDTSAVAALIDWLQDGPPSARVDRVEVTEKDPRGRTDFRITD